MSDRATDGRFYSASSERRQIELLRARLAEYEARAIEDGAKIDALTAQVGELQKQLDCHPIVVRSGNGWGIRRMKRE